MKVAPECLPLGTEEHEKAALRQSRGWQRTEGLKAYTKEATYPDLYCYFDAADATSPMNQFAMRAFTPYARDIGGLPSHGIRGDVVVVRLEPPRVVSSGALGTAGASDISGAAGSSARAIFDQMIGVEEMRDTLLFYASRDAITIARERDMERALGGLPSEMASMMGGMRPVDLFNLVPSSCVEEND